MWLLRETKLQHQNIFVKNVNKTLRLWFSNFSLPDIGNAGGNLKPNIGEVLQSWKEKFKENSISEPESSIENILAYVLNTKKISEVYQRLNEDLCHDKIHQIELMCEKRMKRIPIQYVIGEWDFRNLCLKMVPPVFIPRPETEQLIDIVLAEIDRKEVNTRVLDLCCGSGAISLSLLQERPSIMATAVDQSEAACHLTKANAQKLRLNQRIHIIQQPISNLHYLIKEKFGVIVSNPPYIFSEDLASIQPEIKLYEDLQALDGGADGLSIIKLILKLSATLLNQRGKLFLEVDPRHPDLLRPYLSSRKNLGLVYCRTYRDFCQKQRFVEIMKR